MEANGSSRKWLAVSAGSLSMSFAVDRCSERMPAHTCKMMFPLLKENPSPEITSFVLQYFLKSWSLGDNYFTQLLHNLFSQVNSSLRYLSFKFFYSSFFLLVGAKEGGRELFDDPSYVNVDKPRPLPSAANGNAHRDAFDMSM